MDAALTARIRNAWIGRISGCQLGKPVERLSMRHGHAALTDYLAAAGSPVLRDYVPYVDHPEIFVASCRGHMTRSEPDDDINYSVLALMLLEQHGKALTTVDVARAWLKWLPVAQTYTAERAAYRILLSRGKEWFPETGDAGFDISACSDNPYNDWIGAQIRADVYGWVCPGNPALAADLVARDAGLSHRGDGVHGAVFVAALGAALATEEPHQALALALDFLPADSGAAAAVQRGFELKGNAQGDAEIRRHYDGLSPVHTNNNLALVVWALYSHLDDYAAAIGDVVMAGLDTDCNGATVGALWALQGGEVPARWSAPWQGRVGISLAGFDELDLEELVARTVRVTEALAR